MTVLKMKNKENTEMKTGGQKKETKKQRHDKRNEGITKEMKMNL